MARGMSHKGGFTHTHAASHKGVKILKKKRKKRCITKICSRHKEEDAMKSIADNRITAAGFINRDESEAVQCRVYTVLLQTQGRPTE